MFVYELSGCGFESSCSHSIFMSDFMKGCFLDGLERLFTFSFALYSYDICSSEVFHIPKGNTTQFGTVWKYETSFILNLKKKSISKNINFNFC